MALSQLVEDIKAAHHENFIVDMKLANDINIITMQSNYMKTVIHEHASSLQSDTMEGVLSEPDWNGTLDIHITSQFDQVIQRWVPVLISIMFGRSKKDFAEHWSKLLECYPTDSWEEFEKTFPGVTVDWSDALGLSFLDTIQAAFPDVSAETKFSFLRKFCLSLCARNGHSQW